MRVADVDVPSPAQVSHRLDANARLYEPVAYRAVREDT